MAAESSNSEYSMNWHAISFQSATLNSTSEVIPMGNYYGVNASTVAVTATAAATTAGFSMTLPMGNSSVIGDSTGLLQAGNSSSSSLLLNSIPELQHDAGLAVEWSVDEQYKLEQGLVKYVDEPNIMKYIKIAATLRDKTVRDVAMRCRWMTRKRRKPEDHNLGKKLHNQKDKPVELNSKANISLVLPQRMATYPLTMHHMDQNGPTTVEVPGISGTARHLLEQNAQAFSQITVNLSTFKDNFELLCRTRDNITAILNDMRNMPGIMSQMPPLPVSINEDLANSILPCTTQSMMLSSPMGIQLKREPRC